jgi:hypothetical protein|tara:strand:- start:87 stop:776 length:690 start_codon:yes stop_codon:yes gene_type:complete
MPESPVPQEIRDAYRKEGLRLRKEGKKQPDLEYNGVKYFLDNKGKNHGGWRLRNRGSHSAQGSKYRANKREAVPTKADYQRIYGKRKGAYLYADYKKEMARIWSSRGTPGMDVDHMNSLASGGVEHPNNMRLQNSTKNRSEGARKMTPAQKNGMMVADSIDNQIKVQGPKPTPRMRMKIMNGGIKLNALGLFTEYISAIDELTGGHIDNGIKNGVNAVRKALGQAPNPM